MEYVPISKPKVVAISTQLTGSSSAIANTSTLLNIRSANKCLVDAMNRPIPKKLFGDFWFEGELSILFADTNLGKSILSVQIANAISKGESISGFPLEAKQQNVLYFDFEMSDKQFENRYSNNYQNHYSFDENFLRILINSECLDFKDFETELFIAIENAIIKYDAKVLIIDNLTYLKSQATETSKEALPLMKHLKSIKEKYDLSILALAHTPKRNQSNSITLNDLAGSKQLSNFSDSIFAISESSKDKGLRYVKQLKARDTEIIYDTNNIMVCQITKPHNFLGFEFMDYGVEREHLKIETYEKQCEIDEEIIQIKTNDPSISDREIARQLNTYPTKVGRVLKKHNL
jgi:RecA-family ATPase